MDWFEEALTRHGDVVGLVVLIALFIGFCWSAIRPWCWRRRRAR